MLGNLRKPHQLAEPCTRERSRDEQRPVSWCSPRIERPAIRIDGDAELQMVSRDPPSCAERV